MIAIPLSFLKYKAIYGFGTEYDLMEQSLTKLKMLLRREINICVFAIM